MMVSLFGAQLAPKLSHPAEPKVHKASAIMPGLKPRFGNAGLIIRCEKPNVAGENQGGGATLPRPSDKSRDFMKRLIAFVALAALVGACSPDGDTTGSISSCARELYPSYNSKSMDQCVAVCKKCDRGVTTTCTTSCTLKGAH
jgi:hypothetical protein